MRYIAPYAFAGAKNIKSVKLNKGLVFIGELAFLDCKNLDSATVPDSVRRICSMAFTLYGSASSVAKRYCETQEVDNQSYRTPSFVLI